MRRVRRNFERAAHTYRGTARLELEVGARMLERLDYVKLAPRRILDAGAGCAPQAAGLKRRYPVAQQVVLDIAPQMLGTMKRRGIVERLLDRLRGRPGPIGVCADLARLPLAQGSCSMVWSNMALHWASDVQSAIGEFHRVLEVDGLVMFSTLGPDTLKELRSALAGADATPRVHSFIDMHDLGDMLVAAGFAAPVMDTETITLTYADVGKLLADLRATGQTCALAGRSRGLFGPRRWQRMLDALQGCMLEGRLPITIEVIYGHAWKAAPRRSAEGHAIVRLDPRIRNETDSGKRV